MNSSLLADHINGGVPGPPTLANRTLAEKVKLTNSMLNSRVCMISVVPMKSRGIWKTRAEPRRNLYGALRLPSLGSADTLHDGSPLQERSSLVSRRMSGVMSLNLHEEAVSNIVAYDSIKTNTVDDTERRKAVVSGC